jgi:hypothetical protein
MARIAPRSAPARKNRAPGCRSAQYSSSKLRLCGEISQMLWNGVLLQCAEQSETAMKMALPVQLDLLKTGGRDFLVSHFGGQGQEAEYGGSRGRTLGCPNSIVSNSS